MGELYPICRSLTGDGVRETFAIIGREVPLEITEIASGTKVFDWVLPREWNIRDAWVANAAGERVIDFQSSNLHVLGYSVPIRARMPLAELRDHLHTHPREPGLDPVPYLVSRRELGLLPQPTVSSTGCRRVSTRSSSTRP